MPFLYADQLLLIPVTSTRFLGFDLPFPGGFYNAYVPLMLQRRVYDGINRRGLPFNLYFHPYEHSPAGHNRSLVKYRSLYMSLYAAHLGRYATLLPRITARYRMGTLLQAYARWLPKQP